MVPERSHHRHREGREILVDFTPDRPAAHRVAIGMEGLDGARGALAAPAALPPPQRQVIVWHMDGLASAEVARELGTNQGAVRLNLGNARKNLKRLLDIGAGSR